MCGIAGIVNPEGVRAERALLERMIGRIRYRGPDGWGVHERGNVGLAHARLSIIDPACGAQPMHSDDGSLTISFNGEIFNYVELREALVRKGHRFTTASDTEVILHAYQDKGEACVEDFNGEWAFAIWDARRGKLFASRDRMGVRPFFYGRFGGALVFASEIKSILAHPEAPRRLDPAGLDQVFTFWCNQPPRTIYEGISELPPGHTLTLQGGRLRVQPYWQLSYEDSVIRDLPRDARCEDELVEELRALLVDATRIRLRADVPVGAYLSGGLDSSLITAIIRHHSDTPLKTFSVSFSDPEFDESREQQAVARFLGTDHHEVHCSESDIARVFPEVVWHAEKPILRSAPAPLYLLSKLVRESGYKVVLTGEGSDEIFGGYDLYKEAKIRRFCAAQPDSRLRPLLLKRLYPYLPGIQAQSTAYLRASFGADADSLASPFFSHLPRWQLTSKLKLFYSDELKSALGAADPYAQLRGQLPEDYASWDAFCQAQYLESTGLLPGYILSSQGDRVAMANAVEGRFPFLDHRVVELARSIPPRLKMRALNEKYILKRVARGLVPAEVLKRPKQPYRAPDARSFLGAGEPEYVKALLDPEQLRRDGLFNPNAVQALVAKVRDSLRRGRGVGAKENMALMGILSTQLIANRFIERLAEATES